MFLIKQYFRLFKSILSIAISLSAVVGLSIAQNYSLISIVVLFFAVFLQSAGASGLNQYYERSTDALMKRTAKRPIPLGAIKPQKALAASLILITTGTVVLWQISHISACLGLINVFIYVLVYTPLKYKTNFAIIAGGFVGAIPPLMGWFASEYATNYTQIIFFACFMFLWQIPHFMLLNLKYADDYRKAGISTLVGDVSNDKMKRIFLVWSVSTILSTLLFPIVGLVQGNNQLIMLLFLNILLLGLFVFLVFNKNGEHIIKGNKFLHMYLLLQFLLIVFGRIA